MTDIVVLNGVSFRRGDPLPAAITCERCGRPVWLGELSANDPAHPLGARRRDVWQRVPSIVAPFWGLDPHRCAGTGLGE